MQGVISNYDTDLFVPLIKRAAELTGTKQLDEELKREDVEEQHHQAASLRVIADHARAATFLISDGVLPMNEGRGYVLRKIIRRAIRHGRLLGAEKPFLYEMVFAVRDMMKDAYPELIESANRVSETIKGEETRFANVMDIGLSKLETEIDIARLRYREAEDVAALDREGRESHFSLSPSEAERVLQWNKPALLGADAFKLYDTFGLPRDFIEDVCRDQNVTFDSRGFDAAMEEQRKRAQASWKGGGKATASPAYQALPTTMFEGYRQTRSDNCEVLAIIKLPGSAASSGSPGSSLRDGPASGHDFSRADKALIIDPPSGLQPARPGLGAHELLPGERGEIVLDHTPFYADSGGQVGDIGLLYSEDHNTLVADVEGVTSPVQGVRAHRVVAKQPIHVGDKLDAVVNDEVRRATMRNHTGTHLLHAALREVLGSHVKQAGSLVDPSHLRFDFSHFASLGDEELQDIEDLANREVLRNDRVEVIEDVPIDVAVNEYKAMALFGEKYGDRVRVIRIGDFSTELCGGTHTSATGEIGLIKVLKEGSVSSGVRRLEAVTGEGSLRHFRKDHQLENVVATLVRGGEDQSPAEALKQELDRRDDELKKLRKELEQVRMKSASSSVQSAAENVREVKGIKVLATRADNLERAQLRVLIDNLRNKLGSGVVVLGSVADGKVALIVGVTKDLTAKIQAGKIIAEVAKKVGGSGGGRPDMAEAGGKDPSALDSALADSYSIVEKLLP